jgi:hypothetical protein
MSEISLNIVLVLVPVILASLAALVIVLSLVIILSLSIVLAPVALAINVHGWLSEVALTIIQLHSLVAPVIVAT